MDCVVDETTLGIVVDVPGTLTGVRMIGRSVGAEAVHPQRPDCLCADGPPIRDHRYWR
jgi:hypothetical protein